MPRITVKGLDGLRKHPREYSLLYELGGTTDGIDKEVGQCCTQMRMCCDHLCIAHSRCCCCFCALGS
jgi:hypothetical protein